MSQRLQMVSRAGWTVYGTEALSRDLLLRLVECPELPLSRGPAETIKAGNTALVVKAELVVGDRLVNIAFKRVRRKTVLKRLTQAVRTNRTLHTFQVTRKLERLGVPTAQPLAVIVPSRFAWDAPSYVLTRWLDRAENLAGFAERQSRKPLVENRLQQSAARAVGILLGRLHCVGAAHRDLKAQNVMLMVTADGAVAHAIDLDGVGFPLKLTDRVRWRNLSRLAVCEELRSVSRSTRLRFLKSYLQELSRSPKAWKLEWQGIRVATLVRRRSRAA